jgi:predicted transposase YbfD/YdcC
MGDGIRFGLDEVACHFAELEDPRSEINRRHPLISVVVIAIMAVLAGASGPTAVAKWALLQEGLLKGWLPLPNGIPRKDVFRRVLATVQPAAFQACYGNWLQSLRDKAAAATGVDQPVLAIDGKTLRRSHDKSKGLGALHSVSVWASEFGLSLGQVATDEKSNEITAIPAMLSCVRDGKETADIRYFISSLPMGVQRFAHAVRAYWGIENTCHWSLDVTYREDESRIREQHLRENFAWLNRFTLSLLKQHPGKDSLVMKRHCCSWNDDFLLETLIGTTS